MKKTSKLLAFIIAFAMVMSVMVVPVGATAVPTAPSNILSVDYNAGFETDSTKDFGYLENSSPATRELVTPTAENGLLDPVEGDSYLKFTGRDSYNDRIQFDGVGAASKSVQLEAGKEYEVSYYAATVNAGDTATAAVKVDSKNVTSGNTIIVEGNNVQGENVTITSDKFTKVSAIVKIIENPAENKTSNLGVKIYSYIEATKSFYIDDFCVKEVVPEMTVVATGIEDGATGLDLSATVNLSFTNAPYEMTADNVVLSPAGSATVAVTTADGKNYTVSISNMDAGKKYNLSLNNVQDMYAQFVSWDVDFTTSYAFNILSRNGYDYSHENGESIADSTITTEFVEGAMAQEGSKYLKATDIADGGVTIFKCVGKDKAVRLKAGSTYELSFYARTILDESMNAPEGTIKAYFADVNPETNTVCIENAVATEYTINGGNWTKVTGTVTIGALTGSDYEGINIGFDASDVSGVYIDNWDLRETIPTFKMTSSVEDGAVAVKTNVVYLTFTNAPVSFDENNIDTTESVAVESISDTNKYKVTLGSEMQYGHTYSFTVNNVRDNFGQTITGETISFTTDIDPNSNSLPSNLMQSDTYDWSFESSTGKHYSGTPNKVTASVVTPEEGDTLQPTDGDSYLMLTYNGNTGGGHIQLQAVGKTFLKNGNYVVSVDAALAPGSAGDGTAKINVGGQSAGTSTISVTPGEGCNSNVALKSDSFTTISGLFTVGAGTGTAGNNGMYITISVPQGNNLYIDNLCVKEVIPDFTMTSSFENNQIGVGLETVIPLEFSIETWAFELSSVEVTVDGVAADGVDVVIEKVDELNYNLLLSNLDIKTTYEVKISGVYDNYGRELNAEVIKFTTVFAENILDETDFDFSFENGTNAGTMSSDGAMAVVNASDYDLEAPDGSKVLRLSGRSAGEIYKISNVGAGEFEAGEEYIASYKIKLAEGASDKAGVYVKANSDDNTLKPVAGNSAANVTVASGDGWVDVSYIFTMEENSAGSVNNGLDIGVVIEGNSTAYVDMFEVKKYIPAFKLVTNPADGEEAYASDVVTLNFSNAPLAFDENKVEVKDTETGDNLSFAFNPVSEKVYTLTIDGIEYGKEYTVATTDKIYDKYHQYIDTAITFATTTGRTAIDNNIAAGEEFGFEGPVLGEVVKNEWNYGAGTYTVVDGTAGVTPYEGTKMLKASGIDSKMIGHDRKFMSFTGVEIGKKYVISYYARTVEAGATANAVVNIQTSNASTNTLAAGDITAETVKITSDKWTRVSAVVEIVASGNAGATNRGIHFASKVNGVDYYMDNFVVLELPEEDLAISSSTPADGSEGVNVTGTTVVVNYSETLSEDFDPSADGVVKLYKGTDDVTAELVNDVKLSFGNGGIEVSLNDLENSATYKLVITGATDYFNRKLDSTIAFTTDPAVVATDAVICNGNGDPVTKEAIENAVKEGTGTLGEVQISVTNAKSSAVNKPLYIYTIYNADGTLNKTGSTPFDSSAGLAVGASAPLSHDFGGIDLNGKMLTLYLVSAFNNLTLAAEPLVFDFTN